MDLQRVAEQVMDEVKATLSDISASEAGAFADAILAAERVFVAGAGRTGLAAKAFAMRLMHLGLAVFVVGEMTTPSVRRGDLVVVASGSGATASLVGMAEKAKAVGAAVALVSIFPRSPIGAVADLVVRIPAPSPKAGGGPRTSIQPMGSLFEQSLLIFLDITIMDLMARTGKSAETMFERHANLE